MFNQDVSVLPLFEWWKLDNLIAPWNPGKIPDVYIFWLDVFLFVKDSYEYGMTFLGWERDEISLVWIYYIYFRWGLYSNWTANLVQKTVRQIIACGLPCAADVFQSPVAVLVRKLMSVLMNPGFCHESIHQTHEMCNKFSTVASHFRNITGKHGIPVHWIEFFWGTESTKAWFSSKGVNS